MVPNWVVIVAYVLFVVGGILLIACLTRILWYCCIARKQHKEHKNFYDNPHYFSTYQQDPYLKDPTTLAKRRLEMSPDYEEFNDINISEFMHNHADGSARDLSSDLLHTLSRNEMERTHIDSQTVESQAHYEEPNTNLILALKERHIPPENMDLSLYDSDTALVNSTGHTDTPNDVTNGNVHDDDVVTLAVNTDGALMSKSQETLQVLSALDLATAGEDLESSRENLSIPATPHTPHTPHPYSATSNEPLPVDSKMDYVFSSTIFESATQL